MSRPAARRPPTTSIPPTASWAYVIDPLGHVTEYDYGSNNGVANVLLSTKQYAIAYPLSGLSPSTPPTLTQLQSWVASSPVQAVLSQGTRTDYSYDVRGQLATQTQYDTLTSSGAGVVDAGTVKTTTTYDAQGRLLQSATETGTGLTTPQATSYAYDGLGRLVSRTDALNNVTRYLYTDSSNTIAITQANGMVTTPGAQQRRAADQQYAIGQRPDQPARRNISITASVKRSLRSIRPAMSVTASITPTGRSAAPSMHSGMSPPLPTMPTVVSPAPRSTPPR